MFTGLAFFQNISPSSTLLNGLTSYYNLSSTADLVGTSTLVASGGTIFTGATGSATPKSGNMAQFSTTATPGAQNLITGSRLTAYESPILYTNTSYSYSVSGWFYVENLLTSAQSYFFLVRGGFAGAPGRQRDIEFTYEYNSGTRRITVNIYNGTAYRYYYNVTLSVDTWHHIVLVQSGNNIKVYLNNSLVQNITDNNNGFTPGDFAPDFYIGCYVGANNSWCGYIDEVAVWGSRAITAAEVSELYNAGAGKFYPFS